MFKNGKGATEIEVEYKGIVHILNRPAELNNRFQGAAFEDGDIIYVFAAESEQRKNRFVDKYHLTNQTEIVVNGRCKRQLFTASKGHYVRFVEPTTIYSCLMHPEIEEDEAGKCPKCFMKLSKREEYR